MRNSKKTDRGTARKSKPMYTSARRQTIIQRLLKKGMGIDGRPMHEDIP